MIGGVTREVNPLRPNFRVIFLDRSALDWELPFG